MKPVLLRVLVDLYIQADEHTPDEVAQFREIAGTLAREVDAETALTVACRLAAYDDTPPSVGEALVARKDDAARIILADAHWLPRYVLVEQAAAGNRLLAAAVAARARLEPSIVRLLLSRRDPLVDTTLAANTTVRFGADVRAELLARARQEDAIGRALLSRGDFAPIDRAVLFLLADRAARESILDAAEAMTAGAQDAAVQPPPELLTGLETAARFGDADAFAALLALGLGSSTAKVGRIVADRTGEPLVLALVALGVPDDAAIRLLMIRDPLVGQSTQRVFGLIDLSRRVSRSAARLIVDAILGVQREPGMQGRHVPAHDPAETDRRGQAGHAPAAREQVTQLRQTAG